MDNKVKMLNQEQVKNIKKQIIEQIKAWKTSEEQKQAAIEYVNGMDAQQLEDFLVKNKLAKPGQECPFCLITQGKMPSYKITEDSDSIAVLEINPVSKGHVLIIPKKHHPAEKIPTSALDLAKKIAEKIKAELKPKDINLSTSSVLGHGFIDVIPVYEEKPGERKKASEQELKDLQKLLTKPGKKSKPKKLEKAPRRIP